MSEMEARTYYVNEITENDSEVEQPKGWKLTLKNHQVALIHKCIELENNGVDFHQDRNLNFRYNIIKSNIGIMADKVGSGKSYSVLGLIALNESPLMKFKQTQMYGYNNINVEIKDRLQDFEKLNVNIIVVPHGLIKQWEECITNCSDELSFYTVNTTKSLHNLDVKLHEVKIILVSGTFYKKIQEHITNEEYYVNRVIFDEVDSMNTPNAKHIHAKFYWFVSASFKNILNPYPKWNYEYGNNENHHMISSGINNNVYAKHIFSHFYKTRDNTLNRLIDKIVIKNSDDFVDKSFQLPELRKHVIKCKDSFIISVLDGVVGVNIINCLNAGDISGALSQVNQDNVDTEINIINAVIQSLNIKLNNIKVELRNVCDTIFVNQEIKRKKLLKLETDKHAVENKISLIEERIHAYDTSCSICLLEEMQTKTITKCCNNSFCLKCLTCWLNRKPNCPLCKAPVDITKDLYVVQNKIEAVKQEREVELSKLQRLDIMLSEIEPNSKILIFSEFENSFLEIEDLISKYNIRYAKLKGNGVNKNVHDFKNSNVQILLVNSNAYGSGLNLENTTDVILFHKFDTDIETQIIGRAQRPGRTTALNVWYLLNNNEVSREE
jgi:SNF2 family DNA or RNA helicase